MHNIYLPEIDGSEGLSFVIGTTNCLRESCLHNAHVDVRGVSPFTDTAGDMLLSEISLSWLHKEDANIFLAANNSTLLSTHFFFFCFGIHLQNLQSKSFSFLYFFPFHWTQFQVLFLFFLCSFCCRPVTFTIFILMLLVSPLLFFNNLEGPAISLR